VLALALTSCGSTEGLWPFHERLAQRTPPHRDIQSSGITPRKAEVATPAEIAPAPVVVPQPVVVPPVVPPTVLAQRDPIVRDPIVRDPIVRDAEPEVREPEPIEEEPAIPYVREAEVDCTPRDAVGYRKGRRIPITIVQVDGSPVERDTANAFLAMRNAAAKDGVELTIYSAFRSPEEQEYFYQCWQTCSCNGCSKAAKPGFSNHQMGKALDIAIWSPEVHPWLAANAKTYGFAATVAGEPWHWEFKGKAKKKGKKGKGALGVCS